MKIKMNGFTSIGRFVIIIGITLVILGVCIVYYSKIPFLGKLPGDIYIKRDRFVFYFPITTCIIISIILMLIFSLIQKLK